MTRSTQMKMNGRSSPLKNSNHKPDAQAKSLESDLHLHFWLASQRAGMAYRISFHLRHPRNLWLILSAFCFLPVPLPLHAQSPGATDNRLVVELVASEPDIVTPTGIAVDERGRVWVIENHTHHRPPEYKGPPSDRIRIFEDFDATGRARKISTFAEGFRDSMGLAFGPRLGPPEVFFATRSEIMVLGDRDGDDVADDHRVIMKLDTPGNYPHNGLAGFAFDALDNVYFGMGENLGAPYKLIGSDGTMLTGGGEGGNIFRCRPDGSKLMRVATGFWNPFHLTFDAFGRLFAVDNDPDDRPPCRLLHIIQGGDYGYRFRNGRKGLHPFTAWNGELPGTLPMVAGTAEAPSGIVAYESSGLPNEYRGDLIVTCWGDHVIQRFKLQERGASFVSKAQTLVQGGEDFRPVGIATAPDGSLIVSDWVDKSYPVHGKGRIWRIRMKNPPLDDGLRPSAVAKIEQRERLIELLEHPKQEIRGAAGRTLIDLQRPKMLIANVEVLASRKNMTPRGRIQAMWAVARTEAIGMRFWLTKGEPAEGTNAAVSAELMRLSVEFLHPRLAEGVPPEQIGPTSTHFERKWVNPAIVDGDVPDQVRLQALLGLYSPEFVNLAALALTSSDPFLVSAGLEALGRSGNSATLFELLDAVEKMDEVEQPRIRLGILLALRRTSDSDARTSIPRFLDDPDPGVRRAAIQWVGEERLEKFAPRLAQAASKPPVTRELFEAFLAAQEFLAGVVRKPTDEVAGEEYVAKILADESQPAVLRALALRTLRPDHKALPVPQLQQLISSADASLRDEAVRTLSMRTDAETQEALRRVASDPNSGEAVRRWAIVGLGHSAASSSDTRRLLQRLLEDGPSELQHEALRSLRGAIDSSEDKKAVLGWREKNRPSSPARAEGAQNLNEEVLLALRVNRTDAIDDFLKPILEATKPRPASEQDWRAELAKPGDAAAGERVFFHPRGPQCFACHRLNGRGGVAGPDLSSIGRALDPVKLIRSILTPSKDIAPQYITWTIALGSGQVLTGIIINEDPAGTLTLGDAQGKTIQVNVADIEERRAQQTSIMPDNLVELMTRREFRDLIAFLRELK